MVIVYNHLSLVTVPLSHPKPSPVLTRAVLLIWSDGDVQELSYSVGMVYKVVGLHLCWNTLYVSSVLR